MYHNIEPHWHYLFLIFRICFEQWYDPCHDRRWMPWRYNLVRFHMLLWTTLFLAYVSPSWSTRRMFDWHRQQMVLGFAENILGRSTASRYYKLNHQSIICYVLFYVISMLFYVISSYIYFWIDGSFQSGPYIYLYQIR